MKKIFILLIVVCFTMKKNVFFLLLLLIMGCNKKSGVNDFPEEYTLISEDLNLYENLGLSYFIKVYNDYLLIRDDQYQTKFTIFNINNLDEFYYMGFVGQGPGEFINPGPMVTQKNKLMVYDGGKKHFISFYWDSLTVEKYKPTEIFPVLEQAIIDIVDLSDSIFLAVGIFPQERFALINSKGETYFRSGEYPLKLNEDIPFHIQPMACQSKLTAHPKETKIAVATRYGELLQIYDVDLNIPKIVEVSRYEKFLPEFTTQAINGTPNFRPSEKTRWGYISITSDENQICALYSGKLQEQGTAYNSGNIIHVFDWQGNCLYKYQLDKNVLSISLYNHYIYALYQQTDGGYDITRYKLTN